LGGGAAQTCFPSEESNLWTNLSSFAARSGRFFPRTLPSLVSGLPYHKFQEIPFLWQNRPSLSFSPLILLNTPMNKNAIMAIVDSVCTLLRCEPGSVGRSFLGKAQRDHRQKQPTGTFFQRICALAAIAYLLFGGVAFGSFPPALVVNGMIYTQTYVSDTSYAEYYDCYGTGVFVLYGETGGAAVWAYDEYGALNYPLSTGTWNNDYSQPIVLSGDGGSYTITLPQVILYYSSYDPTPTLFGYDGQQIQPMGVGYNWSTWNAVAYNGLLDGYIFYLSNGYGITSPCYRYGPGGPMTPLGISAINGVFPPSNVALLSSTINFNNDTLAMTSSTDGIGNGYWSNISYQGQNSSGATYGELHIYISGSIGEMWGTVENTNVTAQWNPGTKMFIADPILGTTSLVPTATANPRSGPPQVEVNGTLLPFCYLDAQNNDVYCDLSKQKWVAISSSNTVTVNSAGSTVTGTYDPSSKSFSTELGDCAAVSADGTTMLGLPDGLWVYTTGGRPGGLSFPVMYASSGGPDYSLYRSDGTAVFKYVWLWQWGNSVSVDSFNWGAQFQIDGGYVYNYSTNMVLDTIDGWPTPAGGGNAAFPSQAYIDGNLVNLDSAYQWFYWDCGWVYSFNYSGPGGAMGGTTYGYDANAPSFLFLSISAANGDQYQSYWYQVNLLTSGSSHFSVPGNSGNPINVAFGPMPEAAPQGYPAEIAWNGTEFPYSNSGGGYTNPTGNLQIMISGSTVTVSGTATVTGTYNSDTYQFNFNENQAMKSFVGQDANGNLLGTPVGLSMYFSGTQAGIGQSIKLGDGTLLTSSNTTIYNYRRTDGSRGVKYLGIPQGSLFVVADASGNFTSPVYRYSPSGGDFVLKTGSNGAWASSNLYPRQLYVNGHYASIDATTQNSWTTPIYNPNSGSVIGQESGGQVVYRVQPAGQVFTLSWTWGAPYGWVYDAASDSWAWSNAVHGFSATIGGNYNLFGNVNGLWDGGQVFSGLPSGLVISVDVPSFTAQSGPPQIKWNGVELVYDPQASVVSSTNPSGADVYSDSLGLGMLAMVGADGTVTLYGADGSQYTGAYDPNSYQFTFTGQPPGTIQADTTQGFVLHSSTGRNANDNTPTSNATMEALGNFDVQGNSFSLGNWLLSGTSMPGLILSYANSQPSVIQFAGTRQLTKWAWSHADADGSNNQLITMSLDSSNRLNLFDPSVQTSGTSVKPTIVLDPAVSGTSQFKGMVQVSGTILIQPQGDLDMGLYKTGSAPQ